jgi:hypothetical protein
MKRKEKHSLEFKKTITVEVSGEIKELINKEKKMTGETIAQIIERAVANLLNSTKGQSASNFIPKLQTKQLQKISNDLRLIAYKVEKIATRQSTDEFKALNVFVVGKKHPWQNHPQKEKIFKLVRAMHRVGANISMIASGLNIEGIKKNSSDSQWKATDVKTILDEIQKESDYLAPIYSLPDEP